MINQTSASRSSEQVHLRIPSSLLARIKSATSRSGRSVNGEIVIALETAFPSPVVDVEAVEVLLQYVSSAPNTAELQHRIEEVNARFVSKGSLLRVEAQPNGALTIVTEN
ncbi:Arc family DNA-binding protein [Cypionkella sp.]|uniref:Arc family DNA-binding protein n=1 Tax=Cypionkella sp. TaxID=2811411 RepID=UPI002724397E|nr:Arc family DNA-binding protein [Cypionkella sp.]MDO8983795.1 Arc family DNA-binding protein [Cypionkella sp.]MDP2051647.1 Arc family DNA-binding protein [Cypionkella sp.]